TGCRTSSSSSRSSSSSSSSLSPGPCSATFTAPSSSCTASRRSSRRRRRKINETDAAFLPASETKEDEDPASSTSPAVRRPDFDKQRPDLQATGLAAAAPGSTDPSGGILHEDEELERQWSPVTALEP
ncbi:unnamed protein product, partial [Amoebophrya sp. A120]